MPRRPLSLSARMRIFADHRGACHICGDVINGVREPWDIDHVIPLALGGDDEPSNMAPAHARCHRGPGGKTSADIAQIAKAKRVHAKHIGARQPKNPLPGSRGSKWKRKIGGRTEPRE